VQTFASARLTVVQEWQKMLFDVGLECTQVQA
jgi:hypothetical protein